MQEGLGHGDMGVLMAYVFFPSKWSYEYETEFCTVHNMQPLGNLQWAHGISHHMLHSNDTEAVYAVQLYNDKHYM